jgi:hypothetical protein
MDKIEEWWILKLLPEGWDRRSKGLMSLVPPNNYYGDLRFKTDEQRAEQMRKDEEASEIIVKKFYALPPEIQEQAFIRYRDTFFVKNIHELH